MSIRSILPHEYSERPSWQKMVCGLYMSFSDKCCIGKMWLVNEFILLLGVLYFHTIGGTILVGENCEIYISTNKIKRLLVWSYI